MNPLGIFAKTFSHPTLAEIFDEVSLYGLHHTQFNFSCVGLGTLPDSIEPEVVDHIRREADRRKLTIAALSGTFNLIDPDLERRDRNLQRLGTLASICTPLGTSIISMSTGTRDREDMWHAHPENSSDAAWSETVEAIQVALWITEPFGVTLAVEPEPGNVMSDASKARKLLDEIGSPRLKILFDAANILAGNPDEPQRSVLARAFELAGSDIVLAHGKELVRDGGAEKVPGRGELDWSFYLDRLAVSGYSGPLILHGFSALNAGEAIGYVRRIAGDDV